MRKYFLIIIPLFLIFVLSIYFLLTESGSKITPAPVPTPKLIQPISSPEGAVPNNYSGDKNADEAIHRDYLVGQLINKLPHQETNLLLSYDIKKNIFTATVDSSNKDLGLAQLDAVLKVNGITSRSWIKNLKILYK